jgi:predicted nucleic acid-binding protein
MIILDASALVKVIVKEKESQTAIYAINSVIQNGEIIASPEISLLETLNALWKHHILVKDMNTKEYYGAVERLLQIWLRITKIPMDNMLVNFSAKLALENKITIYDAIYLSSSKLNNATLFSFDKRMLQVCEKIGVKLLKTDAK